MRPLVMRQAVGANHGGREGQDALHVALVHHEIDGAGGLQFVDHVVLGLAALGRHLVQLAPGQFGEGLAPGDDDAAGQQHAVFLEHGGAGHVGIGVQRHVLRGHGALDQRQRFPGAAEVGLAGQLVVRDHHGHVQLAADAEGLFQRRHDVLALVAHMGGVDAAVRGQRPADLDDLLGGGVGGGRVEGAGGDADGAAGHRLLGQRAHGVDLGRRGRAMQVRHDGGAQRGVADHAGGIDGGGRGAQRVQVVGEAGELVRAALVQQVQRRRRRGMRQRRQADAAVAGDHGGHALRDLGRHVAPAQQVVVVVRVRVDEAGRDHQAGHVDAFARGRAAQVAHGGHAVAAHAHVGLDAGRVAAVDDGAAGEDVVIGLGIWHGGLRRKWRYVMRMRVQTK